MSKFILYQRSQCEIYKADFDYAKPLLRPKIDNYSAVFDYS